MRVTVLLLAAGALVAIALAACAANNDPRADTTADDSARADGTTNDTLAAADDSVTESPSTSRSSTPRAVSAARDSSPLPQDSLRAMRPRLPQVVPDSQPGRWRGLKLPERRPVRPPIESIRATEQAPDSVMKGDSTRPPRPDR